MRRQRPASFVHHRVSRPAKALNEPPVVRNRRRDDASRRRFGCQVERDHQIRNRRGLRRELIEALAAKIAENMKPLKPMKKVSQ